MELRPWACYRLLHLIFARSLTFLMACPEKYYIVIRLRTSGCSCPNIVGRQDFARYFSFKHRRYHGDQQKGTQILRGHLSMHCAGLDLGFTTVQLFVTLVVKLVEVVVFSKFLIIERKQASLPWKPKPRREK
ncbi:hypothetical protein GGR55DRAFT_637299 [Xylaria sp. FL0064]|nr:hypothetical protein GGR55DRAFT_637299 [Xylaria sp. FL0064]